MRIVFFSPLCFCMIKNWTSEKNMKIKKGLVFGLIPVFAVVGCGGQQSVVKDDATTSQELTNSQQIESAVNDRPEIESTAETTPLVVSEPMLVTESIDRRGVSATLGAEKTVSKSGNPTDPYTYRVTLLPKDETHPFYGVGDKKGYAVDGVQGKELILERGRHYKFIIQSSPLHDVYISTDEMGWGAKVVEDGVSGNFIYDGVLEIVPNENTPDVIFYQCQNHKAMGGRIFVVDPGSSENIASLRAKYGVLSSATEPSGIDAGATEKEVKQKLSYAALVAMSKPAKRVQASGHAEANLLLKEFQELLAQAEQYQAEGKNSQAMASIDEALRKMSTASQMVPSERVIEEQRQRYQGMLKLVEDQRKIHQDLYGRTLKTRGAEEAIDYDRKTVDGLLAQAATRADAGDYEKAIDLLQQADKSVTSAVNLMMDSQTVVYELNIDTPEGEYQYEKNRYLGYVDLIPVAIEEKQPNKGQRMLFDGFVNKAAAMSSKAEEFAAEGKYPEGIRVMQEATKQVKRALLMLGVKQ